MTTVTPLTHFTVQGTINGKRAIETEPRTLREHVTALEAAAKLLGLPAFSEETTARIDANTSRVYTRAHRWFIDCPHPRVGMIGSYPLADRMRPIANEDWEAIRGVDVDEFLADDFAARRWFPGTGETLRVHPMPLTVETVAAYAELVMSAGGVFEIQDLELIVA